MEKEANHAEPYRCWKRAAEREGKVAIPGKHYSKSMSRESSCLSDSATWLRKGRLHRCVSPIYIFSLFLPQGYLDTAGQPVLCCLGAALALSLLWQSSQLKRWSFSFISDADLADISDCKCFLILPLYVCVCVLLINSQWFHSKWAWQSKGPWQQEHIVGPLVQMHLSFTRHLCSLIPGLFLHQQREEI